MRSAREAAHHLAELLAREHACMAEFLEALAAFDRRRGWEELGYSSLFWFLHRRLGLSKAAAYSRKVASDLISRHPEVLPPLRDGRLCLSSVGELARVLKPENASDVLPRFFHCSRREAAEVRAALQPLERPPSRSTVTPLPGSRGSASPASVPVSTMDPALSPREGDRDIPVMVRPGEPLLRVMKPDRPSTVPLTEDLRRLHLTVSKRFLAKLDVTRDALAHSLPMASMETALEIGLDLVIERHRKRRGVGARARGKVTRETEGSTVQRPSAPDRITAAVKRAVWERDGGRCQWPVDGGGVCGSTLRLEFDHRVPRGMGGASDESNLRLLCRSHNLHAARRSYGDDLIDRYAPKVPRASEPVLAWGCSATG